MKEIAQWVVKLQSDQVKGPFSTEVLRNMIIGGAFTGSEEICEYPQGEWKNLTKQPEFYDALLESLENPAEASNKRTLKMDAETIIKPVEKKDVVIPKFDLKEFVEKEIKEEEQRKNAKSNLPKISKAPNISEVERSPAVVKPVQQILQQVVPNSLTSPVAVPAPAALTPQAAVPDIFDSRNKNLEINMTDLKKLQNKETKKLIPFMLLLVVIVAAGIYLFLIDDEGSGKGWTLIAPKKPSAALSPEEVKKYKSVAVRAFQSGQMEAILLSQPDLVAAIEGAPKDLEAIGLLCMAYEQLWPYTKQTEQDLKSVITTTQMARSINPISNYSDSCQTTFLIAKGQNKEARSLLEKTLDNPVDEKFTLGPFLYLMKAEMLEGESNFINAEAYFDQATKLWPQWVTGRFGLARMFYKQNKIAEARDAYQTIYKNNKESKIALYGLALTELKGSKDIEKASSYFASGFALKQKLPKDFHTEALLSYAKILLDKNDTKNALIVAQEGYRLSPSNHDLKEIVISLGGSEKVDNAQSEIILVGDQFARAGDHMTAQAQYKAAFEVDPKNGTAAFKAAKSLWILNQTRDAINWLDRAIKADPSLMQAYVLKSDYESQKYNFTAAAKTLQLASNRFQQSHEIVKAQAQLEFRKNNMMGAIQYGERAVRLYDADVELLSLLAQAHINYYVNAPSVRKEDQEKKENSKKAAQRYAGRAIDLEPAWPESQITYSKMLAAIDGPVRGEVYLKELIKAYPYTLEYRIGLAEFYRDNEKFAEAALVYEEVVSIDPKNKKANFGLAEAYRILNKPDLAQKYYNSTSALDPSDVEPMFANAKLLIETATGREVKAKYEKALSKLELVKKINPDFPKVSFFMARCFLETGDYGQAIEMIRDEKTRNPSIADSYILAAEIFNRKGQFKECAAEYSAAIKIRPNSAELYVKASTCYRLSDAMDIAQDMLEMAMEKESGYADTYREFGYIFDKTGDKKHAIENFNKYLVLSPNAADKDAVAAKVKENGGDPP